MTDVTICGSTKVGFWINLGPGEMRVGPVYETYDKAVSMAHYQCRNSGIHPLPKGPPPKSRD